MGYSIRARIFLRYEMARMKGNQAVTAVNQAVDASRKAVDAARNMMVQFGVPPPRAKN